ncbi:rhodanese-like domain-containing protein [Segatella copri]|uniref:rhodanese-like domain-containing protein n=1 Tax=Segatella copri TaxID=165179 RepID=UPI001932896B|nr:rhodanese-like domain-containing protein [Segatella copri]MBM0129466.1 rhodanese-like domain-containing protein [Segatella copri]
MKKILLSLLAAVGLSTTGCSAQAGQASQSAPSDGIIVLAPQAFINQAKADTTSILLDVRTSKEYAEGHLAGAHLLDYLNPETFDAGISKLDKSRTYYIYCRSGKRSHGACLKMKKQGFKVYDMEGGILNWTKLGMPVER